MKTHILPALAALALCSAGPATVAQTRPSLDGLQAQINELKALLPMYHDATGRVVGPAVDGGVLVRIGGARYVVPLARPALSFTTNQRVAYVDPAVIGYDGTSCQGTAYVNLNAAELRDGTTLPALALPPGARAAYVAADPSGVKRIYVAQSDLAARGGVQSMYLQTGTWSGCAHHESWIAMAYFIPVAVVGPLSDILVEPLTLK